MIVKLPQEIHAVLGEEFRVTCTAKNDRDAPKNLMFTWSKPKNVQINIVNSDGDTKWTAFSSLIITNITKNYEGKYKCTVDNGGKISTDFKLIIEGKLQRWSELSILSFISTNIERPSPPLLLMIKGRVSALQLAWIIPTNPHGSINHYKVCNC